MALTNNSNKIIKSLELSIQISLSGLSFCILQRDSNTIIKLRSINFEKSLTPFEVLDCLKDLFSNDPDLQNAFQKVSIIHDNDISAQVPKDLFDETYLADYLKFNSKILKSDFIAHDVIETNNAVCVYVPYVNINNFIYDKFGSFTYKHESTILINQILDCESNNKHIAVYLNIHDSFFQVVIINTGELILYNSFEFQTKEDFIYYVLFTFEQLELNPEEVSITLLGNISENDGLYSILYKYVRHVEFGKRFDSYNYNTKPNSSYSDFSLIHSF
mgnify:CR=1 FL=1